MVDKAHDRPAKAASGIRAGKNGDTIPPNRKILAFVREFEDEKILVVANLSRFTQCVELDLSRHRDAAPVEVFGRNRFPAITEQPYLLSLGPHAFQWFHLQPREQSQESFSVTTRGEEIPVLTVDPEQIFNAPTRNTIARLLPRMLRARPWFRNKNRIIRLVRIDDVISLPETTAHILMASIEYSDGEPDTIPIPLSLATGDQAASILSDKLHVVLAKLQGMPNPQSILYGAIFDRQFIDALLKAMLRRRRIKGEQGDLVGTHTRAFREAWGRVRSNLDPQPQTLDLHKIQVTLGEDFVLDLYREVEPGPNPDREMGEFLTNYTDFSHSARNLGALEYRVLQADESEEVTTLGTLTSYVRNAADGWVYTLDHLGLFFERALAVPDNDPRLKDLTSGTPLALASQPVPAIITELLGGYAEIATLLGQRTAELHIALSSHPEIPDFAPEPFTEFYRHGLYHGLLAQLNRSLDALRQRVDQLSGSAREEAMEILERRDTLRDRFGSLRDTRISGMRTRHHGDYHLGNVFYTGNDFIIGNFDGDYTRPMSERRIKRSPIKDVASMVRSFHYVSHAVLFNHVPGIVTTQDIDWRLERWAKAWYQWVSALFLRGYFEAAAAGNCLPKTQEEIKAVLDAYTLEKGLVEVEYELENRPDWAHSIALNSGTTAMKFSRSAGVLLHPTSLPGQYGIGDLGHEAQQFISYLHQGGIKIWQVLPLNPTGYGDSPYQSLSVFAGNPLLISLEKLATEGLLDARTLSSLPSFPKIS